MRRTLRPILALVLALVVAGTAGAGNIRYVPGLIRPSIPFQPARDMTRGWGFPYIIDERVLVNDELGTEASIWIPYHPITRRMFRASYVTVTHTGQGDPCFIRLFGPTADTTSWRVVAASPDSIQTWYFPGLVDSLRFWKTTDTGPSRVQVQAW